MFQSEVLRLEGGPVDGETVEIKTQRGQFLGCGIYNSQSQIVVRRYSRERRPLDAAFLSEKIETALAFRKSLHGGKPPSAERLIWSESDGLPGVIVDRYPNVLVLQTLTLAMGRLEDVIADLLVEKTGIRNVIARNDALSRKLEGLPLEKKTLRGTYEAPTTVELAGITWELDLLSGQKTGFYLDQVHNYEAVAAHARDRSVLDCFTNQGGFALSALKAGAISALGIDQSAEALARAEAAATRNGIAPGVASWKEGNVFDLLRAMERERKQFDLIVLDPPSFTKTKAQLDAALRGYHELHVRGLHLLAPGGLLATFCCSHHVGEEEWRFLLEKAAADTGSTLRLRQRLTQTSDHPIVVGIPETEYLRGYLLEKIG